MQPQYSAVVPKNIQMADAEYSTEKKHVKSLDLTVVEKDSGMNRDL